MFQGPTAKVTMNAFISNLRVNNEFIFIQLQTDFNDATHLWRHDPKWNEFVMISENIGCFVETRYELFQ